MSARKATVVLRPAARRDVRSILLFTGELWGAAQREAYLEGINRAIATLGENPHIDRARDEVGSGLRSYGVRQHIIDYRVEANSVTVLRILHAKMDAAHHIDEP